MFQLIRPSDIPFATDDAHRFLPWLIGIMVGMATLLLCLGITLNSWMIDRHGSYTNSFTVNIPASNDDNSEALLKVHDLLLKQPGIESAVQLGEGKLRDMLKPWLGKSSSMDGLPLPVVFDVTLRANHGGLDYDALQKDIEAVAPGAEVDTHERWVAAFASFSAALQFLTTMLAALIIGGVAITVAFTSRAALKLHGRTVQLLHSIGAEDRYIARQFQEDAFWVALSGALPGCLAAGVMYWAAGAYVISLDAPMMPRLAMTLPHIGLLFLMPLACGLVALLSARFSVLRQLRRVL